jgi:hypothetical protein
MWAALAVLNLALAALLLGATPRRAAHALVAAFTGANAAFGLDATLRSAGLLAGPLHPWAGAAYAMASAALAVAFLALPLALALLARRRSGSSAPLGRDELLVFVFPALSLVLALGVVPDAASYMAVRPLLLAWGVLRYEPAAVAQRWAPLAAAVAALSSAAGVGLVAADAVAAQSLPLGEAAALEVLAVGGGAALAGPLLRLARARAGPGSREGALDIYRAALRGAVAASPGDTTSQERVLVALRRRLRITEREHAVLEAEARASAGRGDGGLGVGALFLGRYRVESPLGEGGFARTYLARDQRLARRVVLKIARWARPEDTKRAVREGRLLAALDHPSIVKVHDIEEVAGEVVLVLEHVPGGSLAQRLARGPLPLPQALAIADDVLAGLEAAHARGIVHRDVKPGNVLLTADGRAKLADFGIAVAPEGAGTVSGTSFAKAGAGTLRYMSPEQARGLEADARSDLYATGVLLYEMLAGQQYLRLDGLAEFEVRRAILEDAPRLPLPGAPPAVNEALQRALAKDPAARPAGAAAMRALLARAPARDRPPPG